MAAPKDDPLAAFGLEEVTWEPKQGRKAAAPSPYLPAVEASWAGKAADSKMGKAFAFTITLNGSDQVEQDKDLTKHIGALRRAGRQMDPPVSVLVQAGEVDRKTGEVRVTFTTREKITVKAKDEAAPAAA
jgi:hypothetical protein